MIKNASRAYACTSAVMLSCILLASQMLWAAPRQIDEYHWDHVDRIVAIGDIHGDFASYMQTLEAAGVVDASGRWKAGETHLVQLGDIPDRGADTTKIIAHMQKLAEQARKQGGRVHNLMGNHEAMNVYGDLRYVSAGEYAALAGRDSKKLRDLYYDNVLADIKSRDPQKFETLLADFRTEWNQTHPLGWVEHQQAWNPRWNPDGRYFDWVMHTQVALQINDMIFVHGGISGSYCHNTLASLTDKARAALRANQPNMPDILNDPNGPLWYRGLSGVQPEAVPETVTAILQQHAAHSIVVGHTPTPGAIWPRYAGRVIQVDVGMSAYYGGHVGYLEVTPKGQFAGYANGKIKLPNDAAGRVDYLQQVIALQGDNAALKQQLVALRAAPAEDQAVPVAGQESAHEDATTGTDSAAKPAVATMPICGISP